MMRSTTTSVMNGSPLSGNVNAVPRAASAGSLLSLPLAKLKRRCRKAPRWKAKLRPSSMYRSPSALPSAAKAITCNALFQGLKHVILWA